MLTSRMQKVLISMFVVLTLVVTVGVGGIVTVAALVACGVAAVSPFDEAQDIVGDIQENVKDSFFNLFASAEQQKRKANAALIVKIGQERGFSKRSIAIAVATSIQESNLENRAYNVGGRNDRDSIGLFQQRPSQGWGTPDQIMDPAYATNTFYDRLQTIPDRDTRPMIDVAMQIQRPDPSAYKSRWAWDEIALSIVDDNFTGDGHVGMNCTSTNTVGWRAPLEPGFRLSDKFGMRLHPIQNVWRMHNGYDLVSPGGTPIYAVHDGEVEIARVVGTYGNYIKLNHGDGVETGYAHLSAFGAGIVPGAKVRAGQVIGEVGSTGGSTGAHLHFEVLIDGKFVDPLEFMRSHGVDLYPS